MKTIDIGDGKVTFYESRVRCSKCGYKPDLNYIDEKFNKQDEFNIKIRCKKCKCLISVTTDFKGDYLTNPTLL